MNKSTTHTLKLIGIYLSTAIAVSLISLEYFGAPWVWVFLALSVLSLLLIKRATGQNLKAVFLNLAVILLTLTVVEAYLHRSYFRGITPAISEKMNSEKYFDSDQLLGYGPVKGAKRNIVRHMGDELIYDATYTIAKNGLRLTPSSNELAKKCLLFFGGSFTFGEGLSDDETLPHLTGEALNNKFRIFNFGFHGYGPHQMLSAIEHGFVMNLTHECKESVAIYTGSSLHVFRVAGNAHWDRYGPKYGLENGKVIYKGPFLKKDSLQDRLTIQLQKSKLYRRIFSKTRTVNEEDKSLFAEVVDRSRQKLAENYDVGSFIVIYWNGPKTAPEINSTIKDQNIVLLRSKRLNLILASDILPGYFEKREVYNVSKYDEHPSVYANRLIANYLSQIISM